MEWKFSALKCKQFLKKHGSSQTPKHREVGCPGAAPGSAAGWWPRASLGPPTRSSATGLSGAAGANARALGAAAGLPAASRPQGLFKHLREALWGKGEERLGAGWRLRMFSLCDFLNTLYKDKNLVVHSEHLVVN